MKNEIDNGRSLSVWTATTELPLTSPLTADVGSDVCIIGAGIAGLSTAYMLAREGKKVVVLDDGAIGGGMTSRTTAHLSNALDDRYFLISKIRGTEEARLAAEAHTQAINKIESITIAEQIDCEFERLDGFLFLGEEDTQEELEKELNAAQQVGLERVELLDRAPLVSFNTGPCLRFPRQGQFHPLKYLQGLVRVIEGCGGKIFTQTHVLEIKEAEPCCVRTATGFSVTADAVVVATNTPFNDRVVLHTKQAPYLTYVIGASVPAGSIHRALYWDTGDKSEGMRPYPYHYIRLERGLDAEKELLIIGGEDHESGIPPPPNEHPYRLLEEWARERFPMIESVDYRWSGEVMESFDGLAFIGRNPLGSAHSYVVTGDSGMGMTHGTIAGMLLTDLIMGRQNPWKDLFDPSRKVIRAGTVFAKENFKVARQYMDWVTPGDVKSTEEIGSDHGAVLRSGLKKVAVYRDPAGALHEFSAVCPHLGCLVSWNDVEKTWDCPCHGSRFDALGKVFQGPANKNLEPIGEVHSIHESVADQSSKL